MPVSLMMSDWSACRWAISTSA